MNWTREQHILAFNLYCRIPFGKMHKTTPEIVELGALIARSPSSVAMKLSNFARLDPALKLRGISGLKNGAKGEQEVWEEFAQNSEELAYASELLMASCLNKPVEQVAEIETMDLPPPGKTRDAIVKIRVNQSFFRRRVLSAYDFRCCVTGLSVPQLLVAGHIIPWSEDAKNRLNPLNGLCLNMLHDKAFDRGFMWIDENYKIRFRNDFHEKKGAASEGFEWLKQYEGRKIFISEQFKPSQEFLKRHAENRLRA